MTPFPNCCFPVLAALIGLGWSAEQAAAFDPQPDPPAFGLVAIIPGQVARLNAVCSMDEVQPGPCRTQLLFRDATGRILRQNTVALLPGQATWLDLPATGAGRLSVQPVALSDVRSGLVIPTVEVYDRASGRTELFVPPVGFLPAVQR
jgi:hypothetical protein